MTSRVNETMANTKNKSPSEALDKLMKAMAGTYKVSIGVANQESVDKLGWLKADERDFLKVTTKMKQDAIQAATEAAVKVFQDSPLETPERAAEKVVTALGESVLATVLLRFKGGKRDVKMRPLSPAWVKKKGHPRIGIYTGDLFRDLLNGTVKIKKVR